MDRTAHLGVCRMVQLRRFRTDLRDISDPSVSVGTGRLPRSGVSGGWTVWVPELMEKYHLNSPFG